MRYTYDTMYRVYVYTPVGICVHGASWNPWKRGSVDRPYPSQQTQENWHNHGVMAALRRELGASTETLLEKSLPKIMSLDAANKAD